VTVVAFAVLALAACATAPIDGLYWPQTAPVAPNRDRRQYIRDLMATGIANMHRSRYLIESGNGVWVVSREGTRLVPRRQLPLVAPTKKDEPWGLQVDGRLERVRDPPLEAALARLKGRRIFAMVYVENATLIRDMTLLLDDGIYYQLQPRRPEGRSCGILIPLSRGPSDGGRTREFAVLSLADSPSACPNVLDPTRDNRTGPVFDGLRFHLGADGRLEVISAPNGYYMPADTPPEEVARLIKDHGLDWRPPDD
jgi:hypothetical protein